MTDEEIQQSFRICLTETTIEACRNCAYHEQYPYKCQFRMHKDAMNLLERLQSENAALRERLEKFDDLHIGMGEKIYIISDDNEIVERFVCGVHVLSTGIIFVTTIKQDYKPCNKKGIAAHIAHAYESCFGLLSSRDFGKRAFIRREAAEARLAELKGANY